MDPFGLPGWDVTTTDTTTSSWPSDIRPPDIGRYDKGNDFAVLERWAAAR